MADDYVTLKEAATIAGYRNTSTLYAAVRAGRLQILRFGPHAHVTTRAWLEEYLQSIDTERSQRSHRGKARTGMSEDNASRSQEPSKHETEMA